MWVAHKEERNCTHVVNKKGLPLATLSYYKLFFIVLLQTGISAWLSRPV